VSLLVPAGGFSNSGVAGANYQLTATEVLFPNYLPIPTACNLTGFSALLTGVNPSNPNLIDIYMFVKGVLYGGVNGYDLCQITPSSNPPSCTASPSVLLSAGDDVVMAVTPMQNGDDTELDGTALATSFTCQ